MFVSAHYFWCLLYSVSLCTKVTPIKGCFWIIKQKVPLNGILDNGINLLMGSNLSHLKNPKYHFLPNLCLFHWLISINRLLESVSLSSKVIPLSGAHCNTYFRLHNSFNLHWFGHWVFWWELLESLCQWYLSGGGNTCVNCPNDRIMVRKSKTCLLT